MIKSMLKSKGFTILELIIAGAIISVGFLSVVSMIVNAFTSTASLSNNLTASYLTQEGFEVVRRIRDTNFNTRYDEGDDYFWLEGLMDDDISRGERVEGSVYHGSTELGSSQSDHLHIDSDGLYAYDSSGERTPFRREITLERNCYDGYEDMASFESGSEYDDWCEDHGGGVEYVLVTVEIFWEDRGVEKNYEAETKLFNWY